MRRVGGAEGFGRAGDEDEREVGMGSSEMR